ncbi:MAG: nucleotidyltransferase family protein [Burkholderiaceae bacterium]
MFPVTLIHQEAQRQGLPYLVIGGHAVNAYCAPRATLDVDFLVRKADRESWDKLLISEGFKPLNVGENFANYSPPYGVSFRLDLMLVNETSFALLRETAREVECLGVKTLVPAETSLIALKVHAIHHGPENRKGKDWLDIENLVRAGRFNPRDPELREIFRRQGTPEMYLEFLDRLEHE